MAHRERSASVRHPLSRIATLVVAVLALSSVACNRRPAEDALQAAEQALRDAPEIERYAPEELAAVSGILRDARASYAAGRYTDALRAAQGLPDRIAAAEAAAAKRKERSAATWSALSQELPAQLETLAARLAALSSAAALPGERLAVAQAELAALSQAWADAAGAYSSGDVPNAVAAAQDVAAKAGSLAGRLGLGPTPPPAPQPR